jgi:hypothetical protein
MSCQARGAVKLTGPLPVWATSAPSASSSRRSAPSRRTAMRRASAPGATVKNFSTLFARAASSTVMPGHASPSATRSKVGIEVCQREGSLPMKRLTWIALDAPPRTTGCAPTSVSVNAQPGPRLPIALRLSCPERVGPDTLYTSWPAVVTNIVPSKVCAEKATRGSCCPVLASNGTARPDIRCRTCAASGTPPVAGVTAPSRARTPPPSTTARQEPASHRTTCFVIAHPPKQHLRVARLL